MTLKQQLQADMKQALKDKDRQRLSLLRMLLSAINYAQIEAKTTMDDEAVIKVLRHEAKKRREAITAYQQANRPELVAKEEAELKLIETYLPKQLDKDQVKTKVQAILTNHQNLTFGQAMGLVMKELKDQADGQLVSQVVKEFLS